MNVIPILKVKALILEKPDCYRQNVWSDCIVGLAARVLGFRLPPVNDFCPEFLEAASRVQKSLKINDYQWKKLVHISEWPEEFKHDKASVIGKTPKERAVTAGKRIDKFISTDGAE